MFKRTEIENQIVQELSKLRLTREKDASIRLQQAKQNKEFNELYKLKKELEFSIAEAEFKKQDTTTPTPTPIPVATKAPLIVLCFL